MFLLLLLYSYFPSLPPLGLPYILEQIQESRIRKKMKSHISILTGKSEESDVQA